MLVVVPLPVVVVVVHMFMLFAVLVSQFLVSCFDQLEAKRAPIRLMLVAIRL